MSESSHTVWAPAQRSVAHVLPKVFRDGRPGVVLLWFSEGTCLNSHNCVFMLPFSKPLTRPFSLSIHLFVPGSSDIFQSRGVKVGESGWVKSRTHEILKSFLGSPHQHMLLSSLVRSLFFCFSCFLCYLSSRLWCQSSLTHPGSPQWVIHIFTCSFGWRTKIGHLPKKCKKKTKQKTQLYASYCNNVSLFGAAEHLAFSVLWLPHWRVCTLLLCIHARSGGRF